MKYLSFVPNLGISVFTRPGREGEGRPKEVGGYTMCPIHLLPILYYTSIDP